MKKRLLLFIMLLSIATSAYSAVNAVNDTFTGNFSSFGYSFATTVTANDIYSGTVTVTQISTTHRGINLSGTNVTVAANVPPGTYTIVYQLCDNATPQSCDTATITIIIEPTVEAVNDETVIAYSVSSTILGNIHSNDMLNGLPATTSNTDFTVLTALPAGMTYNASGVFTSTGVAPGKYVIQYQLCEAVTFPNTAINCDTATFTIYVTTQNGPLTATRANNTVKSITVLNDNRIVIAGDFTSYGGTAKNKIAALNHADLSLNTSFSSTGPDSSTDNIQSMVTLPSGEIIVVGKFAGFGGVTYARGIARIMPNGATGSIIGVGVEAGATIYDIALQSTGHMIIVGDFNFYDGFPAKNIARLNPDGSIDTSFYAGSVSFNGTPYSVAVQTSTNNIIVGGSFTTYQGNSAPGIIRLLAGAVQDPSFTTGPGIAPAGSYIDEVLVSGNDIFIGGSFASYASMPRKNLAKLTFNGAPVSSFGFATGFSAPVRALAIQQVPSSFSGNIGSYNLYVGGEFTSYNGVPVNYLTCLNAVNGQTNTQFDGGSEFNNFVYAIQPEKNDLKILIGGSFTTYNGTSAQRITRIFPGYGAGNTGQNQMRQALTDEPLTTSSITIYPNPSEGLFNIDFKGYDEQKFDITIHNTLGQLIYQGTVTPENTNQIDLTRFESGSYYITLFSSSKTINKVVIKK